MLFGIEWYWLPVGAVVFFCAAIVGGWILGAARDRRFAKESEQNGTAGADLAWAAKVHEISTEGKLVTTDQIDMTELHDRLALEDVEIKANKTARAIVDEAVSTLLDDELWSKYLLKRKAEEVQNV